MKTAQSNYWDRIYLNSELPFPQYDGYLDQYLDEIRQADRIVDLGCGNGVNAVYLDSLGMQTIACDYSEPALEWLHKKAPNAICLLFDMTEGLPFPQKSVDVIIADLSLHYFSVQNTTKVISDVHRVLRPEGLFLCRVNSKKDLKQQIEFTAIDEDFYLIDGCKKRYFSVEALEAFFSDFEIIEMKEKTTEKYGIKKSTIECALRKQRT